MVSCPGIQSTIPQPQVRAVEVKQLEQEELREVVAGQFPGLADITEKILRMFSILTNPSQIQSAGKTQ